MKVKCKKGFQSHDQLLVPYLWERGRWVRLGLRDELVKVTAVWSHHAQEPARVSKRFRPLGACSWVGKPDDKLSVHVANHLHMRRSGGSHSWTGNTEHKELWSLCCRILKKACCSWGGWGAAGTQPVLGRPLLLWTLMVSVPGFSWREQRAASSSSHPARELTAPGKCRLEGVLAKSKPMPVPQTSAAPSWDSKTPFLPLWIRACVWQRSAAFWSFCSPCANQRLCISWSPRKGSSFFCENPPSRAPEFSLSLRLSRQQHWLTQCPLVHLQENTCEET